MICRIQVWIQIFGQATVTLFYWSKSDCSTPLLYLMWSKLKYLTISVSISYTIYSYLKMFLWSIYFSLFRWNTSIIILLLNATSIREIAYNLIVSRHSLSQARPNNFISLSPYIYTIVTTSNVLVVVLILDYCTRGINIVILVELIAS